MSGLPQAATEHVDRVADPGESTQERSSSALASYHDRSGRAFYSGLLEALIQVMGTSNGYLFHHGPHVALLSYRLGQQMGMEQRELARMFFGGVLMDLGMIGLVEDAWENPVPVLSPEVRASVEEHPARSADTVAAIPYLEDVAPLVESHHEWWDGSGYPDGIDGDDIPPGARILRLADTVCALAEERPYRQARDPSEIRAEVRRSKGAEFSPDVVGAFFRLLERGEPEHLQFNEGQFRRLLLRAADDLLPTSIPSVSTEQLLELFGSLVDAKDPYTGGHSRRVASLASAVARRLGLDERIQDVTRAAGYLHDVGKVSVPLRILTKKGRLDEEERREVQRHAATGARILQSIPSLEHLSPACRYHHERWDGAGYPEGIAENRIPLVAQILAVCDAYDAMTSGRAYRPSRSHGHAMEEVDRSSGAQFAPRAVGAFLTLSYDLFRQVKLDDPTGEREQPLPFTERFHERRRRSESSAAR